MNNKERSLNRIKRNYENYLKDNPDSKSFMMAWSVEDTQEARDLLLDVLKIPVPNFEVVKGGVCRNSIDWHWVTRVLYRRKDWKEWLGNGNDE